MSMSAISGFMLRYQDIRPVKGRVDINTDFTPTFLHSLLISARLVGGQERRYTSKRLIGIASKNSCATTNVKSCARLSSVFLCLKLTRWYFVDFICPFQLYTVISVWGQLFLL